MNIIQIVSSIDNEAAGPSYSVPSLAHALGQLGHDVSLMSLGSPGETKGDTYRQIRFKQDLVNLPAVAKIGVSRALRQALDQAAGQTDVFHTHGLWTMPNVYAAWAARRSDKPLVLAPRGMLGRDALKFSANAKRVFWALQQGRAARVVNCFHATSDQEYDDIRAYGLTQPVAIIPNGIDVPDFAPKATPAPAPSVVSLGRVHPKKALDRLIRAWKQVEDDFPDWRLRIVGPSEANYGEELQQLINRLQTKKVSISGPAFGDEKWHLLREAEIFALPTLNENFAMTVAESLAAGTPVISTKGAPWAGLAINRCGWWIDHGAEALAITLREAMTLSREERAVMGARGRAWMEHDYSWERVAADMVKVYKWCADRGDRPDLVVLD